MDDLLKIEKYITAMAARNVWSLRQADVAGRIHPFITISREVGAGGHRLAESLVRQMQSLKQDALFSGWQMMDQELCRKILQNPKLKVSLESLVTEELHSEIEDVLNNLIGGYTPQEQVMTEVFRTIRTLATVGKVIVVGRGGVCLTRDLPYGVHVRLVAPRSVRVLRMMELLHLSANEARLLVSGTDSSRARLVKKYFGKDIRDPLLYDVTWNTDSVSIEEIASSIIGLITSRVDRVREVA
jgi:cytidylate kinase